MSKGKVLVVGDVMLDEFVYGEVKRISPEAATPVLSVTRSTRMVGGAGNVARGVAALDVDCELMGIIGDDRAGHDLISELATWNTPRLHPWVLTDTTRPTTHKRRFVSDEHSSHLLRVDAESTAPLSIAMERDLIVRALSCLFEADVLVLSDYCKGVVTSNVALELIRAARKANKVVIVDSKRSDLSIFYGATFLKLNESEFEKCAASLDSVNAKDFAGQIGVDHLVLTHGERGLTCYGPHSNPITFKGRAVKVRDVSGAGDTVVATLAAMQADGCNLVPSLQRANHAAAIAVGKPGTATVSRAELAHDKIAPVGNWALLYQRLVEWEGKRVGLTNGCFDLLHPGHVHLLTAAKSVCDRLIVAINSDDSVRRLKGNSRPIQTEDARASMLAALDIVDLVVIFDEATPLELCQRIKPHSLIKGGDYKLSEIIGREYAEHVHIVERIDNGPSTSQTIERVKAHAED